MAEYIDREKAVRRIRDVTLNIGFKDTREAIDTCIAVLDCEPSAVDAVQVVRCKDCKYLMFSDCYGECGAGHLGIVRPDDFCSRGKRKEDAE